MTARNDTFTLMHRLGSRDISLSFDEANTLRRAEIVLQRWSEAECGDSNEYASYSIERDEETGKPYRCVYRHDESKVRRYRIPDREAGALHRVAAICKAHGLHYFHQGDPRGCALYVDREPLPDDNYLRGVSCCVG